MSVAALPLLPSTRTEPRADLRCRRARVYIIVVHVRAEPRVWLSVGALQGQQVKPITILEAVSVCIFLFGAGMVMSEHELEAIREIERLSFWNAAAADAAGNASALVF